jgi:hypothetical protein
VLIAPSGIGVPVAAWPGLGPHDEVDDATALLDVLLALDAVLVLLELLELLPHPARTVMPTAATSARLTRIRDNCWWLLTVLSSSADRGPIAAPAQRGNNRY